MKIQLDPHLEIVLMFIDANVPAEKRMFVVDSLSNFAYPLWAPTDCCEGEANYRAVYDADASDPVVESQQRQYKTADTAAQPLKDADVHVHMIEPAGANLD